MPEENRQADDRRTTVSASGRVIKALDGPLASEYERRIGSPPNTRTPVLDLMMTLALERLAQIEREQEDRKE